MKPIILYADDENVALRLFTIEVKMDGRFEAETVASGELALSKIRKNKDKYAVVILDINMGADATGIETANMIKRINPDIPIFIFSGYDGGIMQELSEKNGAIFKYKHTTSIDDLLDELADLLKLENSVDNSQLNSAKI